MKTLIKVIYSDVEIDFNKCITELQGKKLHSFKVIAIAMVPVTSKLKPESEIEDNFFENGRTMSYGEWTFRDKNIRTAPISHINVPVYLYSSQFTNRSDNLDCLFEITNNLFPLTDQCIKNSNGGNVELIFDSKNSNFTLSTIRGMAYVIQFLYIEVDTVTDLKDALEFERILLEEKEGYEEKLISDVVDGKTVYRNQDVNTMYEFYLKWKLAK